MIPTDPAERAADADLASARFRVGMMRCQWRRLSYEFPVLIVAVAAIEPDGACGEYCFRFDLTGFPGVAPDVRIWDWDDNLLLPQERRPKGSSRVIEAFKSWGNGSVYRPWDRQGGAHNNWAQAHPELAWHPKRDLTFIMEDLHGLLTSNALARGNRLAA